MSRIGREPITVPAGVKVEIAEGNVVTISGKIGTLTRTFSPDMSIKCEDGKLKVERPLTADGKETEDPRLKSLHGLTRALLNNMVVGVSEGFTKTLVIKGVGYRAVKKDNTVRLYVGYSLIKGKGDEMVPQAQYCIEAPEGITLEVPEKTADPMIIIKGADKQVVGQIAAVIRGKRPPEPYHGKGIQYQGERVRRKAGKTGK